ncbi:hypothetical protein I4U23_023755 [Adineta vaga]|nr:hypothetical protein I4U23_023755 [Adineta vaga]
MSMSMENIGYVNIYVHGKVYKKSDHEQLFEEKQSISLAKLFSKYHQLLITNSSSLSTNKKSTIREYFLKEFKQSSNVINESFNEYYLGCYLLLQRLIENLIYAQYTLWRDLATCLSTFCTSLPPYITTDVDRMRIYFDEYMKQISDGVSQVPFTN